jgi:hypothetical protein
MSKVPAMNARLAVDRFVCHQKDAAEIFEKFLTEWYLISRQITGSGDSMIVK